ncbi:MAG: class I SAM-dependent methyltransferase [Thermocrispum sp.]
MADTQTVGEQALVRVGWELVDVLGRLGTGLAQRAFDTRWTAERARAAESLQQLKTGPAVSDSIRAMYEGPSNWTRFRRTLDFVRPGERLFEIGLGRGYLAGMFLRDGQAGAYRGIDLEDSNVEATRETLELNGVADRAEVSQGDLYDLTLADVEQFGADLVVCCEVIEHVPDPEAAVQALADALPPGADLLISVPLLGRLEGVWGHLALFDVQRVRSMVTGAGLVPHAVDVVDNTWVFVLASKDEGASPRATAAAERPVDLWSEAAPDPHLPRALRRMDLSTAAPSRWTKRLARSEVTVQGADLLCTFTGEPAEEGAGGQYGGVQLPVSAPLGLRLELGLDDIESVRAFYVDAYAGTKRVARWKWEPAQRRPKANPATFVLRRGNRGRNFVPVQVDDLHSADAFEVFARIEPGTSARFRITRASLLTG